jgi:ABC-type multidrug transport system ATPase subunit
MDSSACAITGLVKRFGETTAVDGLSFRVPPGRRKSRAST